jgi:predicted RNase H-like nuclease (RuvC/YqgF family)
MNSYIKPSDITEENVRDNIGWAIEEGFGDRSFHQREMLQSFVDGLDGEQKIEELEDKVSSLETKVKELKHKVLVLKEANRELKKKPIEEKTETFSERWDRLYGKTRGRG